MTAQHAAERVRVVVSNDARCIVYSPVSRRLNEHILDCDLGCRGGSGWDLCSKGNALLDDLLSASMSRKDEPTWY